MHSIRNGKWVPGSVATNPSDGDTITSTGALKGGWYLFCFNAHASVDAIVSIVKRNAADSADLSSYDVILPAGVDIPVSFQLHIPIADSERVILRMKGSVVGTVQGNIIYGTVIG